MTYAYVKKFQLFGKIFKLAPWQTLQHLVVATKPYILMEAIFENEKMEQGRGVLNESYFVKLKAKFTKFNHSVLNFNFITTPNIVITLGGR